MANPSIQDDTNIQNSATEGGEKEFKCHKEVIKEELCDATPGKHGSNYINRRGTAPEDIGK